MSRLWCTWHFTEIYSAHGIRRGRPITLQISSSSPLLDDTEDPPGLHHLADILRPFDDTFFAVWTGSTQGCSKEWLLGVEAKIRTALPDILHVPNEQAANLRVSQLWLQIKLWELFPRFGFLSSASTHDCLTFRYPISIARDLAALEMTLPVESMQVHGVGMVSANPYILHSQLTIIDGKNIRRRLCSFRHSTLHVHTHNARSPRLSPAINCALDQASVWLVAIYPTFTSQSTRIGSGSCSGIATDRSVGTWALFESECGVAEFV